MHGELIITSVTSSVKSMIFIFYITPFQLCVLPVLVKLMQIELIDLYRKKKAMFALIDA